MRFLLIFISLMLISAKTVDLAALQQKVSKKVTLHFHDDMPKEQKFAILQDLDDLSTYKINASGLKKFREVFGGNDTDSFFRYLDERLNIILPPNMLVSKELLKDNNNPNARVMAVNESISMWFDALNAPPRSTFTIKIGTREFPVTDTRVGVIRIADGFVQAKQPLVRIATLIHEARHSDCSGGLKRDDWLTIKNDPRLISRVNNNCGHIHVECEKGHDLEGLPACDGHEWGAYAITGLAMLAVANHCENCTEKERFTAQMLAIDSFMRVSRFKELPHFLPNMNSEGMR